MLALVLGACASAPSQPANGMTDPGDRTGEFLITKGGNGNVTYTWDLGCVKQGAGEEYACEATVGTKVNVSVGIFDDTLRGKLEDVWSGHAYKPSIDGHPVNLEAFGFIDVVHPKAGPMRHWNVVVLTDKAGAITIRDSGSVDGDPFESTMTYTFTVP